MAPLDLVELRLAVHGQTFNEIKFNAVTNQMKKDALDLAEKVAELITASRCEMSTYYVCAKNNYDACTSVYPSPQCLGGPNYLVEGCSGNVSSPEEATCSGWYDFSTSTIRFPAQLAKGPRGNPTDEDPDVIEAICSTMGLDHWFQDRREEYADFWADLGVEPRAMYFGSTSGAFRIWPGRHSEVCGYYDPRVRPWYVAGSSGPKNVVLIIDMSGSMNNFNRLQNARDAAERVIETLTTSDRITIVPFAETADAITDEKGYMLRANETNKKFLLDTFLEMEAFGSTNYYDAFERGFQVLEDTIAQELHSPSNTAVLFLTDGVNSEGPPLEDVMELVTTKISSISKDLSKSVLLFTYSLSDDTDVHVFPAELACAVDMGVWTKIAKSSDITDALSSYYGLFAVAMGGETNRGFAAWVEPYRFATGNVLGTTVSVPVYDRTLTPPRFLGVVGVDFSLDAINSALGGDAEEARDESISRIVQSSEENPPELELTQCELQAWSQRLDTDDAPQCGLNCTGDDAVEIVESPCLQQLPYPDDLFHNFDLDGVSFKNRVCCSMGVEVASGDQCPLDPNVPMGVKELKKSGGGGGGINPVVIAVPVPVAGLLAIAAITFMVFRRKKGSQSPEMSPERARPPPINEAFNGIAIAPMEGDVYLPPDDDSE
eukprot:CAMPEP_0172472496 /NCGR_PEP_ID=MMETSP1065-20121228/68363_1 /TAXON_ID=265537 /ORGANISM="Amphiprora paludosa, Strain CCMP125" /LENGTH=659 /DNA_ID=CAMNT_0013230637 /DNA_START=297 /DNA_END=2277 /DNA_ORIENTATION=-